MKVSKTTMSLQRWKEADDLTKFSVFGFLRRIENSFETHHNMPLAIKYLCIIYYFIGECFCVHGDNIMVNEERNIAEGTGYEHTSTVYGSASINLCTDLIKSYKWTFKVTHNNSSGFEIGIDNSGRKFINGSCHGNSDCYYYMLRKSGVILGSTPLSGCDGYPWENESVIEMKIHKVGKDYELVYYLNGKKDASIEIFPSVYNLAVSISSKKQNIKLIKHETEIDTEDKDIAKVQT